MGITAVIVHVIAGAAVGAIAPASALTHRESNGPGLALAGLGAIAISLLMVLHYGFWSDPSESVLATFAPDFLSPGRREKILMWYALAAAGVGAVLVAMWARIRGMRR